MKDISEVAKLILAELAQIFAGQKSFTKRIKEVRQTTIRRRDEFERRRRVIYYRVASFRRILEDLHQRPGMGPVIRIAALEDQLAAMSCDLEKFTDLIQELPDMPKGTTQADWLGLVRKDGAYWATITKNLMNFQTMADSYAEQVRWVKKKALGKRKFYPEPR